MSSKKRAKRKSATKPTTTFHPGDYVRVQPGIRDPDFKDCVIAGWTGRVLEIEMAEDGEWLCTIAWDRRTRAAIPVS